MKFSEFSNEKELEEDFCNLLQENRRRLSKEEMKEYLKTKDTPTIEKITKNVQEEIPVDKIPEVSLEQEIPEVEHAEINKTNKIIDNLLDEYEDPQLPVQSKTGGMFGVGFGGGGENNTLVNAGGGVGLFRNKHGSDLYIKSLSGTGSITITDYGDFVEVNGTDISGTDSWIAVSGNYYTSNEVNNLLNNKADFSAVSADLDSWPSVSGNYYTSSEVNYAILSASFLSVISQTVLYVATSADDVILCSASNVIVPSPVGISGKVFNIKNRGSSSAIISATDGALIDNETTQELFELNSIQIVSDNASYWIL